MRPVRLSFSGLNSYRTEQTIDFEKVTDLGLFGIFGPTGSGKSTILDAMTLALYGKVERAPRGTQGIVNHDEKKVIVAFTFDIGAGRSRTRYRAERSYAGRAGGEVRTAQARLIKITRRSDGNFGADEQVLCDRDRDVTEAVTAVIGLGVEDFTRAVVLPQGRFAEFLSLKGKDRRQMLERIFGLERFGKQLQDRLQARVLSHRARLEATEAEQRGLGDASEGAITAARNRLKEAQGELDRAQRELSQTQSEFDAASRVWALLGELRAQEAKIEEHARLKPEIDAIGEWLRAAERAEATRPHLGRWDEACVRHAGAVSDLQRAAAALSSAAEAFKLAKAQADSAKAALDHDGPTLMERLARLRQALEEEMALKELEAELDEIRRSLSAAEAEISRLDAHIAGLEEISGRHRQVQETCRERLSAVQISPSRRRQVTEAYGALRRIIEATGDTAAARLELSSCAEARQKAAEAAAKAAQDAAGLERELAGAEEGLAETEGRRPVTDEGLRAQMEAISRAAPLVADQKTLVKNLTKVRKERDKAVAAAETARQLAEQTGQKAAVARERVRQGEAELEAAERELERWQTANSAGYLAARLISGEPCPVCGSPEHPHPAAVSTAASQGEDADASGAEDGLRAVISRRKEHLREVRAELLELEKENSAAQTDLTSRQEAENEAGSRIQELELELAAKISEIKSLTGSEEDPAAWLSRAQEAYGHSLKALDAWRAEQQEAAGRRDRCRAELGRLKESLSLAERQFAAAEASENGAAAVLDKAEKAEISARESLDQVRGDLSPEEVEAEYQKHQRWDQERAGLEQEFALAEAGEAEAQKSLTAAKEDRSRAGLEISRGTALRDGLQTRAGQLFDSITRVTQGCPAAEVLAKEENRLNTLRQKQADAQAALEAAQTDLGKTQVDQGKAAEAERLASEEKNQAAARLDQALTAAGFPDAETARASLRSQEEQNSWRHQIEGYAEEAKRLKQEEERLTKALGGESLTPEGWEAVQAALTQAKEIAAAASQEFVTSRYHLQDLQAKRARWEELETDRRRLMTEAGHLEILQSNLRGSTFVEFLAAEQVASLAAQATERLKALTGGRYGLLTDDDGSFVIRDEANGGASRASHTLSGGETFLTSLALALALSAQIQLHGLYPLEFFFLDEGFGTLDPDTLDTVMTALERLRSDALTVGLITHVPELRARIMRRIIVDAAEPGGRGSRLRVEAG